MKRIDRPRTSNILQTRRSGNNGRRDQMPQKANGSKPLNAAQLVSRVLDATAEQTSVTVSDSTTGSESSEVYENMVVHYMDDAKSSEEKLKNNENLDDREEGNEDESDSETNKDSVSSSQGDSFTTEDEKPDKPSRVFKSKSSPDRSRASKSRFDSETSRSKSSTYSGTPKKSTKPSNVPVIPTPKSSSRKTSKDMKLHSTLRLESSDMIDYSYKSVEEVKEDDVWEDALNGVHSVESDNEIIEPKENRKNEDEERLNQKIETLETRIEKLEEELREVAALEISLFSVVQEHGSSAHKLHTPARRLSRLYIHANKNWNKTKLATLARNTVSGLVLVGKSCGNDVTRLTFWLSNIIVLREIISQALGSEGRDGEFTKLKQNISLGSKQVNGFIQVLEDWHKTGTFIAGLEKVESWIFARTVESMWCQVLTPHMRSPAKDSLAGKTTGKLLGPALGNQQQGSFSSNLWENAFQEALYRLCPVRAGRHECGCLPVLARLVMEQCVARLDVAMFNAILRESAHQIPTDPISDPIGDSKVLPFPAGDLSFGSGAQLKNAVGNWLRWLTEVFGTDADDSLKEDNNHTQGGDGDFKPFCLLNELSDLLMLPKDLLMDRSIREEVCPSIGLALIKRILCNFTPDEFCPDPVPGIVLEELNSESMVEQSLSRHSTTSFPRPAAAVFYAPPTCADLAEKEAEFSGKLQLSRNASMIQKKGYSSEEELEGLNSPLTSIIDKADESGNHRVHMGYSGINERYGLLRGVWSAL